MIDVRPATVEDSLALAELRWEFRSAKAEPVEDRSVFLSRCAGWMRAQLTTNLHWRAWAATRDGRIIGQLWAHVIDKVPNPANERERHLYLSNLYVTPHARGGVGARLIEAALHWASTEHIDRALLWPTERSRSLYARYGFALAADVLELTLHR
jgi:GNAT superfamily N-acetyltransferase